MFRPCGDFNGLSPVSYTHLDVYKRQENNRDISSIKEYIGERIVFLDSAIADGSYYGD